MRALRFVVVSLFVLGLVGTAAADEKLMKEVEAFGDKIEKAMVSDNPDAMLGMYVKDAISLPNFEKRMDGIQAMKQHHVEMAAAGMKIKSFTCTPVNVWQAGDEVIEIGTFTIALDMPGMPGIKDKGKYMTVYVRDKDKKLKIKAEIWNTDMNPMEMGGGGAKKDEPGHEGHGH